ncbi:hypothetical protein H0H81_006703 [Sphagnurus paluster]|uniref:Matrin-type domain-containing protein n=1 Tax=Sphagnurus paluster TaxID=117069 RepID=A0A9P7FVH8_9AGAR|nr:hypothetical protein H0H81_006703 [Sphagnurus paluster]
MSEYWVSKKKYFCKYCDIYIADDAPSRQQHENGLRHKGNVERFIRGLYKTSEKRKKDQDEEAREMARVNQAAQAAYAQDVASGRAKPGSGPTASTSAPARKPTLKPANPFTNYSTAQSLGFTDPDAERIAAEADLRRTQGVAGEWEVVAIIQPPRESASDDEADEKPNLAGEAGTKREAEAPPDDEDARQFKLRKKTWGGGLGEVYDPGAIPIKLKKKEEPVKEPDVVASTSTSTSTDAAHKPTDTPKWTKVQWRRPGEDPTPPAPPVEPQIDATPTPGPSADSADPTIDASVPPTSATVAPHVNTEAVPTETKTPLEPLIPKTEETSLSAGMFRKRKLPAGGNKGRRT